MIQKRLWKIGIGLWVVFSLSHSLASSGFSITGQVMDASTGRAISGVNVSVIGTEMGDVTDAAGEFRIGHLAEGRYTILCSHIGYANYEKAISLPHPEPLTVRLRETFFQMGEVVVTGTRTEKVYKDTPITTEVISRKDILDSGARDIGELLEERAGTFVHSSVAGGSILNLLGIDSKHILILVDSQPVTGRFNDRVSLDQFSTAIVEKVEIIKGPSSSLYGSEAMGGIVNIITRKGMAPAPYIVHARYTGSDHAYNIARGDEGKRDMRLNLLKKWNTVSGNFDLDLLKANVDRANQYINVDEFGKVSIRGNIEWKPRGSHSLEMEVNGFAQGEDSHTRTLIARTDIERNSLLLRHSWLPSGRLGLETILRRDTYHRRHVQKRPWGEKVNDSMSKERQFELEQNITYHGVHNTANLGVEINRAFFSGERIETGKQERDTESLYFQLDSPVAPRVTSVVGTRFDYNTDVGLVSSPRIAFMYSPGEYWKFRGAWGTGFRLPSFMDLHIDWNHEQFGYRIMGNPALKPESSRGYSFGVEYYHPGRYQVSLMLYRNRFKDMITERLLEPGLFTYENVEKVQYTGFELQGRWNISSDWLTSWGYNYLDNRDLTSGKLIPNTQPHSATLRVSFKSKAGKVSSAVKAKVVGPYYPEEYRPEVGEYVRSSEKRGAFALVNVTGKIRLSSLFVISLGIQNLGNYKDERYGPFVGRTFYVELVSEVGGGR